MFRVRLGRVFAAVVTGVLVFGLLGCAASQLPGLSRTQEPVYPLFSTPNALYGHYTAASVRGSVGVDLSAGLSVVSVTLDITAAAAWSPPANAEVDFRFGDSRGTVARFVTVQAQRWKIVGPIDADDGTRSPHEELRDPAAKKLEQWWRHEFSALPQPGPCTVPTNGPGEIEFSYDGTSLTVTYGGNVVRFQRSAARSPEPLGTLGNPGTCQPRSADAA